MDLSLAREIEKMADADQEMRENNLRGGAWDDEVDARHTARMREIVARIGWPTVSRVGMSAAFSAWLLVQHADHDPLFQMHCLDLMLREQGGEVDLRNIAMLTDRVLVNGNRRQLYGTQFREVEGKHVPLPIEDPESVDERRRQMGLGTLEEGIAQMYRRYPVPR